MRIKHVYLVFIVVFEVGLIICAIAKTSHMFVVGRAVNGLGAAGQFNGCMLIMSCVCDIKIRPLASALAISMISVGSMTGPIIAGVVTAHVGWRWCKSSLIIQLE
jgi:MFS family permease